VQAMSWYCDTAQYDIATWLFPTIWSLLQTCRYKKTQKSFSFQHIVN